MRQPVIGAEMRAAVIGILNRMWDTPNWLFFDTDEMTNRIAGNAPGTLAKYRDVMRDTLKWLEKKGAIAHRPGMGEDDWVLVCPPMFMTPPLVAQPSLHQMGRLMLWVGGLIWEKAHLEMEVAELRRELKEVH